MSWQDLMSNDYYTRLIDKSVNLTGSFSTIYVPKRNNTLGYENLGDSEEKRIGVPAIANSYTAFKKKAFFLFEPTRAVFYKFKIDPMDDNNKGLIFSTFEPNDILKEDCFVKTSFVGYPSPWGDHYLKVAYVLDTGIYRTLNRNYFLRLVSDSDLINLLEKTKVVDDDRGV